MDMTKPTPGPWILDGPTGYDDPKTGSMIYATHGNGHLVAKVENEYSENQPLNARLIAAAPDLLAALKLVHVFLDSLPEGWLDNLSGNFGALNEFYVQSTNIFAAIDRGEAKDRIVLN